MEETAAACVSKFFQENSQQTDKSTLSPRKVPETSLDSSQDSQFSFNSTSSETDDLTLSQLTIEEHEPLHIEPFFNITPREMPVSPHNVIEEAFKENPWALLIATVFLTKTSGIIARPHMKEFFDIYPTPYHVIQVNPTCLERFFEYLGLKKRAYTIWKLSYQFVSARWRRASDLFGIGKYGEDAYRIFCLAHTDLEPEDRYLKLYANWLRRHTNFLQESGVDGSEYVIEDPIVNYYRLTLL